MMHAEPQPEHLWLQKLIGNWTFETEANMGPDQPSSKFAGKEVVRSLGGLWMLCEGQGAMPEGGTAFTLMTLGFDPERKKYLGTFIGSMMTHMWVYEGERKGNVLTLNTVGPSFTGDGAMVEYQDIIELKSDDHRVLSSQTKGPDGSWTRFMTANYHRVK